MLITNGTIMQSGVRRRTIHRQVSLGPVSLRIVTIVIFAAVALGLVAQQAHGATKVYREEELKKMIDDKQDKIRILEGEQKRFESLHYITGQATSEPTATPEAVKLEESKTINALPGSDLTELVSSADR